MQLNSNTHWSIPEYILFSKHIGLNIGYTLHILLALITITLLELSDCCIYSIIT